MTVKIVIPDDYQNATVSLGFLNSMPGFAVSSLGDIALDIRAEASLSEAAGLILIRERTQVDAAFLAKLPRLKVISQTGKVARHIDMAACTRAGVAVVDGVGSPVAPAELTWLLIMAARRKLVSTVQAMRQGLWQTEIGFALNKQTLGILGYGKIGKRIAGYGKAFGMHVQVYGSARARSEALADGLGAPESRQEFFSTADVVTVHQRLVPENVGNITAADLAAMRPSSLFVNTSRAELVEPGALQTALRMGRPGYAALDVYEMEPIYDKAHPLLSLPNVLCTPHIGYVECASYELYFKTAFENAVRFLQGDTTHVLNPEAL